LSSSILDVMSIVDSLTNLGPLDGLLVLFRRLSVVESVNRRANQLQSQLS